MNEWFYSLIGLGVGILLSRVGRWLLETRDTSPVTHSTPAPAASSGQALNDAERSVQRLDVWLAVATAAGFGTLWLKFGPSIQTVITSTYFAIFLLIFVLDIAHRWVPNALLLPAALLALTVSGLTGQPPLGKALLGGTVGFGWFYLVALAYRGALGAGDVKLAGLIGLMTGFPDVFIALTIGILAGGIGAAGLLISGRKSRKSYIPYAPFLITGALLTLIFGAQIVSRLIH